MPRGKAFETGSDRAREAGKKGARISAEVRRARALARPPSFAVLAVCVRPDQVAAIAEVAQIVGVSRSFIVREALSVWLAQWEEAKREGRRYRGRKKWGESEKGKKARPKKQGDQG